MRNTSRPGSGFTLIELLIVVVVIAVLLAIAIPLYGDQVRQARRADAQRALMDLALEQEKYRANCVQYAPSCTRLFGSDCDTADGPASCPAPTDYTISISNNSATTYTLTADPTGGQTKDSEQGTACDPLTLDQSDDKTPDVCW